MHVGIQTTAGWGEKVVSHRAKEHTSIPSQPEDAPFVRPQMPVPPEMISMQQVKVVTLKGESACSANIFSTSITHKRVNY